MLRFILLRGVLAWGIGTFVLFTLLQVLQHKPVGVAQAAIYLGLFMLGGVFWGAGMWRLRLRQHAPRRDR
jgi:hypothetical protein